MPTRTVSHARLSTFLAQFMLVIGAGLFGALVGHWIGAVFFVGFACLYIILAYFSSGRYPLDLHDGEVIDGDRAPETIKFTQELAASLGMDAPDLYYINIAQPQICVCGSGSGSRMRGRIGLTKALLREADAGKLRVLLSVAVARIWSGNASAASPVVSFTGLFYQLAQSDWINTLPTSKSRDPETELSPVGGFMLSAWSGVARAIMSSSGARQLVLDADCAALNIGQYSYRPEYIDSALRWLASKQFPQAQDPIATYNPAEVILYLVSPFEEDFARPIETESPKPWRRHVQKVTSLMPTLDERIANLRSQPAVPHVMSSPAVHEEFAPTYSAGYDADL